MNRLVVKPTPHSRQTAKNWRSVALAGKLAPASLTISHAAENTPIALPATGRARCPAKRFAPKLAGVTP